MKKLMESAFEPGYYKSSFYNIVVPFGDASCILYNTLTGSRARIAGDVRLLSRVAELERPHVPVKLGTFDVRTEKLFIEGGFWVDARVNELDAIRDRRTQNAHNPRVRRVTVIVTRACNLKCAYCFQDRAVQDGPNKKERVLTYLESQIVPSGLLLVTWFGGEPILKVNTIITMSDHLIGLATASRTEYDATISTNSVLLNEERIQQLVSRRVTRFQITLDGPAPVHELRRPANDKSPTYTTILRNIALLVQNGAVVTIKVMVDRENWEQLPLLFHELAERGLLPELRFALQHTEAKLSAKGYQKRFGSFEEFSQIKLLLLEEMAKAGYRLREPSQQAEFCAATSPYSSIVDMSGNLYRCATETRNQVGYLSDDGEHLTCTNSTYDNLFTNGWFACAECATCKVLPICGGGCMVAGRHLEERDVCSFYKLAIKDYLRLLENQSQ